MPLFCFKSKYWKKYIVPVGIKVKMQDNVNTFYNIGAEKNWIKAVLIDSVYNGINTHWVTVT
jgi:hypothetical protein